MSYWKIHLADLQKDIVSCVPKMLDGSHSDIRIPGKCLELELDMAR